MHAGKREGGDWVKQELEKTIQQLHRKTHERALKDKSIQIHHRNIPELINNLLEGNLGKYFEKNYKMCFLSS